jgi:hypothetical protein
MDIPQNSADLPKPALPLDYHVEQKIGFESTFRAIGVLLAILGGISLIGPGFRLYEGWTALFGRFSESWQVVEIAINFCLAFLEMIAGIQCAARGARSRRLIMYWAWARLGSYLLFILPYALPVVLNPWGLLYLASRASIDSYGLPVLVVLLFRCRQFTSEFNQTL